MSILRAKSRCIRDGRKELFLSQCREKIKGWARKQNSSDFFSEMGKLSKKEFLIAFGVALLDIVIVAGVASIIFRITFFRDFSNFWGWFWSVVLALALWIGASIIIYRYQEKQAAVEKRLAEKLMVK
ncbi:MAG TPA: hypothetical protein P5089_02780 [Candidatus Portnoybacteria bacterium]|nr:hypothetical protein [Candidatus Portnoybacteria bacterium]